MLVLLLVAPLRCSSLLTTWENTVGNGGDGPSAWAAAITWETRKKHLLLAEHWWLLSPSWDWRSRQIISLFLLSLSHFYAWLPSCGALKTCCSWTVSGENLCLSLWLALFVAGQLLLEGGHSDCRYSRGRGEEAWHLMISLLKSSCISPSIHQPCRCEGAGQHSAHMARRGASIRCAVLLPCRHNQMRKVTKEGVNKLETSFPVNFPKRTLAVMCHNLI